MPNCSTLDDVLIGLWLSLTNVLAQRRFAPLDAVLSCRYSRDRNKK